MAIESERMSDMKNPGRTLSILVLLACLAVSLVAVVYPIYVIRPFRAQGSRELMAALAVSRFGPLVTAVSALAAVTAALACWSSRVSGLRRMWMAAGAMLVCVLAVLARVNVYEALMFHALEHPAFAAASDVKLDNNDKVIVVKIGGSARAYPIREMAYHHVVNDVVGGTALVATY
jgi:Na+/proline symporter